MSTFNPNTGPRGQLPNGYTQEQLDEIRAFNANLTQAPTRSRSSRGRGAPASRNGRARSGATASNRAAVAMGPYTVTSSTASRASKALSPPKVRDGTVLRPRERSFNVPFEAGQSQGHGSASGRERIVTNMTPDDPSKPWIPAHLHQTSTKGAIDDIVAETRLRKFLGRAGGRLLTLTPLEEVTSDGATIPAMRPRGASQAQVQSQTGEWYVPQF